MKTLAAALSTAALVVLPLSALPLSAATAAHHEAPSLTAKKYSNCTALQRDWPNGVARNAKAARKQVRDGFSRPASGPNARKTYKKNNGPLDRDNDGTACEN